MDFTLTREEFERLWEAACQGDELDRLIFVLAAQLGLRASEIAGMHRSWIDFQRQVIRIPAKDEVTGFEAKTKAAQRVIPYGKLRRAPKVIQAYFDFHDRVGITRYSVWARIKAMAKRAGLTKRVFPHSLRATAAFMWAEAGFSAQALRQVFGWSDLNVAQAYIDRCGRAAEVELEEKVSKLW